MTKIEFNKLLSDANLSKKEFSNLMDLSSVTVNGWGGTDKPIPTWVNSWLENYIKAKRFDLIVSNIKPYI